MSPTSLMGIPVVIDPNVGWEWRQVRFPRSKKKRIRRKWAKRPRNFKSVQTGVECYLISNRHSATIYGTPAAIELLRHELEKINEKIEYCMLDRCEPYGVSDLLRTRDIAAFLKNLSQASCPPPLGMAPFYRPLGDDDQKRENSQSSMMLRARYDVPLYTPSFIKTTAL